MAWTGFYTVSNTLVNSVVILYGACLGFLSSSLLVGLWFLSIGGLSGFLSGLHRFLSGCLSGLALPLSYCSGGTKEPDRNMGFMFHLV